MTQSLVSISIIDDNILEGNESIDLFVNSSSLHGNLKVRITRPNQVTVIIVDNDCKYALLYSNHTPYACKYVDGSLVQ